MVVNTSHVLVLSVHSPQLDRRILHQMNALAESGRRVTLVSLPALVPMSIVRPEIEVIAPTPALTNGVPQPALHYRLARKLPEPLRSVAAWLYRRVMLVKWHWERDSHFTKYFFRHTPAHSYAVIHAHDLDTIPAAFALRDRIAPQAKIIYDAHEMYPFQTADLKFQSYWSKIERQYIHRADAVITVNDSIAGLMAEMYKIDKPTVIFNSHDAAVVSPITRDDFFRFFAAPDRGFNVLFQGSLTDYRNLANLVKAFERLGPDYRLFVLGSGPYEREMRETVQSRNLKNVFLGGWVPQQQLAQFTPLADLGIIPYYEEKGALNSRYCTPNKLFEYIEAGLPICAGDLPELRKLVQDQGIGRVYPLLQAEDIAAAIADCRERIDRGEFSVQQRQTARELLGWPRQAEKLLTLYDRLGL